jgi:hypothetical protein
MAIPTLRNLDGGTRLFTCKTFFSKHEHCSKDDGQPPDRDFAWIKIAAKLGLVGELAATAPTWTFFDSVLFLQSTKSVQGAR